LALTEATEVTEEEGRLCGLCALCERILFAGSGYRPSKIYRKGRGPSGERETGCSSSSPARGLEFSLRAVDGPGAVAVEMEGTYAGGRIASARRARSGGGGRREHDEPGAAAAVAQPSRPLLHRLQPQLLRVGGATEGAAVVSHPSFRS
jgi:hypothetical protein